MTDFLTSLASLRRPKLLIRAAQAGLRDYNRSRDLARVLRVNGVPAAERALGALVTEEQHCEERRRAGEASYSFSRHIELLVAMMAEARLLPHAAPEGPRAI